MDREAGLLSEHWEVLARVLVDPAGPPRVQWNLGAISDIQLSRGELDGLAKNIFLLRQIEWSG